jgi:hypothetical protein
LKEAIISLEVKEDLKIYVPKTTLRLIGAKKGDIITVKVCKKED